MSAPDPSRLATNRGSALLVTRITYYLGLMLGTMFAGVAGAIYFSGFGNLSTPQEKAMVASVFGVLSLVSYVFAKVSHARLARMK